MTKNRIDTKLAQCKAEGKKALITFITAGDGGYDCTEKAVLEMVENGADLIELACRSLTRLQKVRSFSAPASVL